MLAISTATKKALVALEHNGKRIYKEIEADCRQSEKMMQEIDEMLRSQNLTLKDVGNFALVTGPGSFTGLRIGASLLKGFCAGQKMHKIVPIPTMDLIAFSVMKEYKPKSNFSCYMNAQSGRYYSASYNKKGEKTCAEHIEDVTKVLKGRGAKYCLLEEAFLTNSVTLTCENLLELALKLEAENVLVSDKELSVKYIRKSSAEENL